MGHGGRLIACCAMARIRELAMIDLGSLVSMLDIDLRC